MGKSVAFYTLGCKVNHYETQAMRELFMQAGYEIKDFEDSADIYVINTCTVTNIADRKSRQMLHRAKKRNPDAVVAAVGCYAQGDADQLALDDAVDLVVGNDRKGEIVRLVENEIENRQGAADEELLDINAVRTYEPLQISGTADQTRVYIKIQDGCNQFCSYCIIPYARGRIRSRKTEEITEEVKDLACSGVKEVVLTGIHVCSFGRDRGENPEEALLELMRRIQLIAGIERIRLGSLEPRIMTEDFVRGIASLSKVCPHFHLSLQSGCDATLKRMNRHYTAEEYLEGVQRLRAYFDRPAITTDVIVGFPGETEEEFAACRAFLETVGFYEIHVFKYSVRRGTVAEKLPDQVSDVEKTKRSQELLALTKAQAETYRTSFLGEQEELLLEEKVQVEGKAYYTGHTKRYVEGLVPAEEIPGSGEGRLVSGEVASLIPGTPYVLLHRYSSRLNIISKTLIEPLT